MTPVPEYVCTITGRRYVLTPAVAHRRHFRFRRYMDGQEPPIAILELDEARQSAPEPTMGD